MSQYAKAPFPYHGGKGRLASIVWEALGRGLNRYIEPFFGSGAVLLRCPSPAKSELVCDLSPHLSNFWRSIQNAPDEVAKWADFPTSHMDLHARHRWLTQWAVDNHDAVWNDPEFHDPKAAGWWAWGKCAWIGGSFAEPQRAAGDTIPKVNEYGSGVVVNPPPDKIPLMRPGEKQGTGVNAAPPCDVRPFVHNQNECTGPGLSMQTQSLRQGEDAMPLDGARLQPWLRWLHQRLRGVMVLHRPWQSAVTDIMTLQHAKGGKAVGIFLDPPYKTEHRNPNLYGSDLHGTSDDAAAESYEWAVEAAKRPELRIAYCCRRGDFPLPEGWTEHVAAFSGVKNAERRKLHQDCIMFSPSCFGGRGADQKTLFE